MKRTAVALTALMLVLALTGCDAVKGVLPPKVPDRVPDITGVITSIEKGASGDVVGGMLVEDPGGANKAFVAVIGSTAVLVRSGGDTGQAAFGELRKGDRVQVWFTGPVAESYPVQATAEAVLVTP